MSDERVALDCPSCGGPISLHAPFCFYCRRPLETQATPTLERGATVYSAAFPRDKLPGEALFQDSVQRGPEGIAVRVDAGKVKMACPEGVRLRNGGVVLRGGAIDPDVAVSVLARAYHIDKVFCAYTATLRPTTRSFFLGMIVQGGEWSDAQSLRDWEFSDAIAPVGYPNQLELLCEDSVLQLRVNGRFLASINNGVLGFGSFGWRVMSTGKAGRALLQTLEIVHAR